MDRILASDSWIDIFCGAKAASFEAPVSDNLPLILWPIALDRNKIRRRFKFEIMWVKEWNCRDIVSNCWEGMRGFQLMDKLETCSKAIWDWGKKSGMNFQQKLDFWSRRMVFLRNRSDHEGVKLFAEAQKNYLRILEHQHCYWKQKAKTFWFRGGDINSSFFHKSVRRHRYNNTVSKLKNAEGIWCEKGPDLDNCMLQYFNEIFQSKLGDMNPSWIL